jgi:outer membrane protein assembly factor BamB
LLRDAAKKQCFRGSPGGALTISSDRAKTGTGILWATVSIGRSADHGNAPGGLYAFNAETVQEIWDSEQNAKRDRLGTLEKFVPPLVVNGRVYVPNYDNAVNVYGIL